MRQGDRMNGLHLVPEAPFKGLETMATAREELEKANRGQGCLGKAKPDEPVFILRAQDMLAPDLVDQWAIWANQHGCNWDKVREAKVLAQEMREWPQRKYPD